ncbi:MAG: FAD-binding protein [Cellulomonadaceae bacterium]|nr:FAD-binding protein [Cellulomonadaceae bacterium]
MADKNIRVDHADVVIVGAGAAGMTAAMAAADAFTQAGRKDAVVALVSKVYPVRSHTVAAEGGAAGVMSQEDSPAQHAADTVRAGAGLAHEDAVQFLVQNAPGELAWLERLGMPWSRDADGRPAVRPFGGMSQPRTWFAADKTGFHMMHTLFQTSLRFPGIRRYDEHTALDLVMDEADGSEVSPCHPSSVRTLSCDDGEGSSSDGIADSPMGKTVRGAVVYDHSTGCAVMIEAPSVVVATGGFARAWGVSTNAGICTGDGHGMAVRAGLGLRDMEMVQVHPTALAGTGLLITEAARGEGGVLRDKDGRRYLADYGLGPETPLRSPQARTMELGPRDALSQAFWKASRDGRTAEGDVVFLDLTHLPQEVLDERLPGIVSLAKKYAGVDARTEPIPVRPAAHYTMGGIVTTATGQVLDVHGTPVAGLFAAGECASTGVHGANRLGSNSLVETLVSGRACGEAAADPSRWGAGPNFSRHSAGSAGASQNLPATTLEARAAAIAKKWTDMRGQGTESPAEIRDELGQILDRHVGIYRDAEGLQAAAQALEALALRYANVHVKDISPLWNTNWTGVLELGNMLDSARCVVAAARARQESRGAHQRVDFPGTDPTPRHTIVTHDLACRPHMTLQEVPHA